DGVRHQRWHSVRGTRRDAERERTRLVESINSGSYIEPSKLTVGSFLQHWLENYARPSVAAKTCERYAQLVAGHLIPNLGHIPLAKLQPLHIQGFYATKLATGRKDGTGGLSAQTVVHLHRVLRAALGQAVRWQLLSRNPADAVEPPRTLRKEMKALDEQGTV